MTHLVKKIAMPNSKKHKIPQKSPKNHQTSPKKSMEPFLYSKHWLPMQLQETNVLQQILVAIMHYKIGTQHY
jgi:hypothetical protein